MPHVLIWPHSSARYLVLVLALALAVLAGCGSGGSDATGGDVASSDVTRNPDLPPRSVPLDHAYRFDELGALSLDDATALPAAPGAVAVRWYTFRGWYTAVFEDAGAPGLGAVCVGASIRNATSGRFEYIGHSPTTLTACQDDGAGAEVLGSYDPGARATAWSPT